MQRILLTMIAVFACLSTAVAEQPRLKVEVDRAKIFEGESIHYAVTLDHVQNPQPPDMKAIAADFDVATLPERSMNSSNIMIINGKMTKEEHNGRQYNYRLTPRRRWHDHYSWPKREG